MRNQSITLALSVPLWIAMLTWLASQALAQPQVMGISQSDIQLYALSGDGLTAVGDVEDPDDEDRRIAAKWTPDGGVQLLTSEPSTAQAVSEDGRFIAGLIGIPGETDAFIWSEDAGITVVSGLDFSDQGISGISHDGKTMVAANGQIWTEETGWRPLASPCGHPLSMSLHEMVNEFCNGIVANCGDGSSLPEIYRWAYNAEHERLVPTLVATGALTGGISDDSARVAFSTNYFWFADPTARPQLWEEGDGVRDLTLPDGDFIGGNAFAISGNGLVVGGACWNPGQSSVRATIWIDEFAYDLNDFVQVNNDPIVSVVALSYNGLRMIVSQGPFGVFTGNSVYWIDLFPLDTNDDDGDGLLNGWETEGVGIPYFGIDGQIHTYELNRPGDNEDDATIDHKNLFVEVDVMSNVQFGQAEADDVISSFFVAPVDNPDGIPGILLHVDITQDVFPFEQVTDSVDGWPADAQQLRSDNFGTLQEQQDPNSPMLLAAKAKAYRYCVVYNDVQITTDDNISIGGQAELPGDDMVLYLNVFDQIGRSATFMHELGHNLGLGHGGCDHINGKPNYPSIMNYTLVDPQNWSDGFWQLDYSREELAPIDEASLDELVSVGAGGSGYYAAWLMPYFSIVPNGAACHAPEDWDLPKISYASLDPGATTDFNLDCDETDTDIEVDLNFLEDGELPGSEEDPTPGEVLRGWNDWANIQLAISDGGGAFRGPPPPDGELTDDQRQFMRDNFPPPPGDDCVADWNADGDVDTLDVLAFLNAWAAGDADADINGDGSVNTLDVLAFLNAWAAGC